MKNNIIYIFCALFMQNIIAQKPQTPTPSEIYFKIEKLNVLASAMYIAAHPDDENTRLITYLTHHDKAYTNYLSLTRGNGGQNLISNELGTDLGIIRTNELWNARKIDGGKQFFSMANDFGFSKKPNEALEIWGKKWLLEQMVYMIRKEQPDVIINRFDHRTEGNTHGHHTASAQLSKEAFTLANDSTYELPSVIEEDLPIWKTKRLFFNVSWFFFGSKQAFNKADKSKYIPLNIGVYYNLLGKNNQEIASLSRSQHQSQGFGDMSSRGEEIDYVELVDGDALKSSSLFEGIDTSWNRIKGGNSIQPLVTQLINEYDFTDPSKSINLLTKIYSEIDKLPETIWKTRKQNEVKELIKNCAGLFLDITTNEPYSFHDATIPVKVEVANRSNQNIVIKDITLNNNKILLNKKLENKEVFYDYFDTTFNGQLTDFKRFVTLTDFIERQFKENPKIHSIIKNKIGLEINGVYLTYSLPIQYRYKDVVKGEVYKPFHVIRKVSVKIKNPVYIAKKNKDLTITAIIDNYSNEDIEGIFVYSQRRKPNGNIPITLKANERNREIKYQIQEDESGFDYDAGFYFDGKSVSDEIKWIDYDHIPLSYYYKQVKTRIIILDKEIKKQRIGYIMGAGDEIPQVLENVGYQVDLIDLKSIKQEDLSKYETIIVGIRAFNTESSLKIKNKLLFDYVKNGGTVITQYQTNTNLQTEEIAPYNLKIGKTRITNENAVVKFINPNEPVLNKPFKITQKNFQLWVQEQGLYYADEFASEFQPVFTSHDFDEKETNGALLIAKHGKGHYIYTGLSFFRQLPAGNTGALELFINLIELKNE